MTEEPAKLDRRVIRTRKLLRNALMELILEKGYDAVTVQDITDRADLGRATFYVHYRGGKEQLLVSNLEEIYDELVSRLKPLKREGLLPGPHKPSQVAFEHAAEHHDLYLVLLRSQAAASIAQRIREYLAGVIHQELEVLATESPIPLKVIASYMAGSLIALITWWLENDMPYSPEYMSQIFSRLTMPGVRTLLAADAAEPLAE
ncbi:MAG: TetR family transcriptional regulator [Anaerolineaceae bacterium]|nr:TetR family transcriptional regulator [Anaerolineaceae bacterium]